jgi:hypothetical protein
MAFSGDSDAMDKNPGQRQRDSQQQPRPQPGRQKNPHTQHPFLFSPPGGQPSRPAADRRTSSPVLSCASAASPVARLAAQPGMPHLSSRRYPQRGALITTPERVVPRVLRGTIMTSCSSWPPGRMVIRTSASAAISAGVPPHRTPTGHHAVKLSSHVCGRDHVTGPDQIRAHGPSHPAQQGEPTRMPSTLPARDDSHPQQ